MMGTNTTILAAAAAGVFMLAPDVTAQQQRDSSSRNRTQSDTQRDTQGNRQQGQRMQQRTRGQRSQQDGQGQQQLKLDSWVRVAYDYDNDNRWDAVEWVFAYDLAQAQRSSQRRQQQGHGMQQGSDGMQQGMQQHQLSGTVQQVSTKHFAGVDEPHVIARVRTDQGRTARVDLGPRSQVRRLDLKQGDRVSLQGRRGTMNDRSIFVAESIRCPDSGRSARLQRQDSRLQRIQGQVSSTYDVRFRESNRQHTLALVRTHNRQQPVLVDLGPKNQLRDVDLNEGDRVTVLASEGTIENQRALFAETIRTQDGQTISVSRSGSGSSSGNQGSSNRGRSSGSGRNSGSQGSGSSGDRSGSQSSQSGSR